MKWSNISIHSFGVEHYCHHVRGKIITHLIKQTVGTDRQTDRTDIQHKYTNWITEVHIDVDHQNKNQNTEKKQEISFASMLSLL